MQQAGQKLRRERERLSLRYRDVEEASQRVANQHGNDEFLIGLSRLSDIENKGTVPSLYRLYSLCAIYGLDMGTVLRWYGVPIEELPRDAASLPLDSTRPFGVRFSGKQSVELPVELKPDVDPKATFYLSRSVRRWGRLPLALVGSPNSRQHRYAFIGTEDWSMHPILRPGTFVQIDETRNRVAKGGWLTESERPIYFIEHRAGFRCGWCTETDRKLVVWSHASSEVPPEIFQYPGEAEIVGQVVAAAMRFDLAKRRRTRS